MPLIDQALSAVQRTYYALLSRPGRVSRIYLTVLFVSALSFLACTPVGTGDTDLWYHLNGGRLLLAGGQFPDTGFYSFFAASREWVNYFWGFQALSYGIHEVAGYPGLVALRVLLSGATIALVAMLLIRHGDNAQQRAWALALLALALVVLSGRTSLIRPHLVSYFMIAMFLFVLTRKQQWAPLLPALTIIWVNLHGVEWPVGAAVCGAYFLQAVWDSRTTDAPPNVRLMMWTAACVPAMFVNPFGLGILVAPFSTPDDVYLYIRELQRVTPAEFFTPTFQALFPTIDGAVALLAVGTVLALSVVISRRALRPAPLLLAVIGVLLVTRGVRFIWEWLLLTLPLWRMAIDNLATKAETPRLRPLAAVATLYLLATPLMEWGQRLQTITAWPLNRSGLPVGVSRFLSEQGITGKLVAPPGRAGYLEWQLYPQILTSGDMQTPPTTPWDHFRVRAAYRDARSFARIVEDHQPDLVAASRSNAQFADIIAGHPRFRPVFFDDHLVLYADERTLPELVRSYRLDHVNPYDISDTTAPAESRLFELKRVAAIDPEGDRVQHGIVRLLFDDKQFETALPYARAFAASRPEDPNASYLLGNVLENLNRCDEARPMFLRSMRTADKSFYPVLHRHLGACAYLTRDFDAAFEHFARGINTYNRKEDPAYLYQYAFAAAATGRTTRSRTILKHLLYALDPAEQHLRERAEALMADLPGTPNE